MSASTSLRLFGLVAVGAAAYASLATWQGQGSSPDASGDDPVVAPTEPRARRTGNAESAPAPAASAALAMRARSLPSTDVQAFASKSWLPPPPPPPPAPAPPPVVAAAPPPPPTAPPLPFAFVGMVERGADRPRAYLAKGDALLIVGVGDQIEDNRYRIDVLTPSSVVLTYLPLNQQQTLSVPGAKP